MATQNDTTITIENIRTLLIEAAQAGDDKTPECPASGWQPLSTLPASPLRQTSEALGLPYSRLRAFLAMAEGRTDGTGYARPGADDVDVWVAELAAELQRRASAVLATAERPSGDSP